MNKGMLSVGIIILSLISLLLLSVLSNYSTGGELDYYLVKEAVDGAMVDALDASYKRTCGLYRMDKEKFVESFLYRFSDSVDTTRQYDSEIYDINEVPPKVSIRVNALTALTFRDQANDENLAANITTSYDAILETTYLEDTRVIEGLTDSSDMCMPLPVS